MNQLNTKHSNYSQTYHDPEAAKSYQQKFNRTWHAKLGSQWEMKLTTKALMRAGEITRAKTGKELGDLTVLDYPCGAGRLATMLASHTAGYFAGDHSPHMVDLTSEVLKNAGLGEKLIGTTVGDIKKADLENQSVDIAASMRLLHHFPCSDDRIQILKELNRVTRHALITTFHDANTIKQKRYIRKRKRLGRKVTRVILSQNQFREEAKEAGWDFVTSWQVSSFTSGLCIAVLQQSTTHP